MIDFAPLKRAAIASLAALAINLAAAGPSLAQTAPTMIALPTGSRLATWTLVADGKAKKTPIIFLHGGPGMFTTKGAREKGAPMRAAGFTTIYYDQAGGGQSGPIAAAGFTMQRAVDDLEALRVAMHVDKIILWGSSFGADLAAFYIRRFPDRVAGLILTSPGMYPAFAGKRDYGKTNRGRVEIGKALSKAIAKIDKQGAAAEATLSQADAGKLFGEIVTSDLMSGTVCKGSAPPPPFTETGGNLYANRMLLKEVKSTTLATGIALKAPSIIIRGDCDFIPVESAKRYQAAFGGSIVAIENTGHDLIERSDLVVAALTRFATIDLAGVE